MDEKLYLEIAQEQGVTPSNELWCFAKVLVETITDQKSRYDKGYDEGYEAGYDAAFIEAAEALASWMRSHGMSPGYAATFTELLGELNHAYTLQPAR